uniref:F-box domain-containing protein n=1 Tax=Brassica oleracea TaxID=3712 RepID=A0A3P6G1G0_BRAOL|nr:unnamed protein product [Brassica oleracea]
MKRVKRSEKPDERNVNDPFKKLPNDMNVVILMKLPPGSIARLHFASKHLSSIILDKKFTELYMTRSSTQPRHLVSVHGGRQYVKMQRFHSISQEYPLSSNHDKVSCKPDPYGPYLPYEFTPPVRGLICGRNGTKVKVGNPSTGQFSKRLRKTYYQFLDMIQLMMCTKCSGESRWKDNHSDSTMFRTS